MTKMFKSALLAASAAASFAVPAMAADTSVLVVDFGQVFQDSAAGKSGTSQLSAKYQTIVNQRQAALQSAVQSYQATIDAAKKAAKPNTPIPVATQQSIGQAEDRARDAQGAVQQTEQEVNQVAAYIRSQIVDKASPIAEQIRTERRAAVVLDKGSTVASDPSVDITSTVIQRLDASFTTPSIVLPTGPAAQPAAAGKAPQGR